MFKIIIYHLIGSLGILSGINFILHGETLMNNRKNVLFIRSFLKKIRAQATGKIIFFSVPARPEKIPRPQNIFYFSKNPSNLV